MLWAKTSIRNGWCFSFCKKQFFMEVRITEKYEITQSLWGLQHLQNRRYLNWLPLVLQRWEALKMCIRDRSWRENPFDRNRPKGWSGSVWKVSLYCGARNGASDFGWSAPNLSLIHIFPDSTLATLSVTGKNGTSNSSQPFYPKDTSAGHYAYVICSEGNGAQGNVIVSQ